MTTPISRGDATAIVQDALARREMTFAELARRLDRPRLWVAAATLGQHPFSADEATKLVRSSIGGSSRPDHLPPVDGKFLPYQWD